jgi:hypothetical protein
MACSFDICFNLIIRSYMEGQEVVNPSGSSLKLSMNLALFDITLLASQNGLFNDLSVYRRVIGLDDDFVSLRACISSMSIISEIVMISSNMNFISKYNVSVAMTLVND